MLKDAIGVVFVFNPDERDQEGPLEQWCRLSSPRPLFHAHALPPTSRAAHVYFGWVRMGRYKTVVGTLGLKDSQCLVFAHRSSTSKGKKLRACSPPAILPHGGGGWREGI